LRGERLNAKAPYGHWDSLTFIAGLRFERGDLPWLIDGPVNCDRFELHVEPVLLPTLGDRNFLVVGNSASYRRKAARRQICSGGGRLNFLPKYPLDLNPIWQLAVEVRRWRRKLPSLPSTRSAPRRQDRGHHHAK